jgi:hypothetical protein
VYSVLVTRWRSDAGFTSVREPKLAFPLGPISWSWAMSSPLVASPTPEQAVPAALRAQSNQFRVSLRAPASAYPQMMSCGVICSLYFPALILSAVRPSPNRS